MTQLLSKRPDQFCEGVWPGYFSRARGAEVWDLDGNRYVDMSIAGIGANVLGYADPEVDEAVRGAVSRGVSCSLNCVEEVELAELLCEIHPWAEMVRFTRSGGEAMAVGVRIARAATARDKIAFCGYHGWHDWYLAANLGSENALGEHLLPGLEPNGVPKALSGTALPFRFNRIEELEEIVARHGSGLAAIVAEPVRSHLPQEGFLQGLRDLAQRSGAVLIFDEISSGLRLNSGGAHLLMDASPDLAIFSKALGNGYAISAVIGRSSCMQSAQDSFISSTNWTEAVGPAAALATLRKHRRLQAERHLGRIGDLVQRGWREAAQSSGLELEVAGIPPLSHFAFRSSQAAVLKALFVQMMLERGFLASTLFYAMLAHSEQQVESYIEACRDCFASIAQLLESGRACESLRGKPAASGFKRLTD